MSTTYTVTAVTDWRVTVIEDRGDGHTTTWEIPLAWVDGPVVGEPLRGVVYFKPTPPLVAEAMAAIHDRTVFGAGFIHRGERIDPDRMLIDQTSGAYVMKEAAPQVAQPLEPVAAQCRFPTDEWVQCDVKHARMVIAAPHEWPKYEVRMLYTAPKVAQPLTHSDEDRVEALLQRNHQHIAAMEAELAALKAQAAQPLTDEQIALAIRAPSRGSSLRRDGSTSFQIARAIERACAEKWGVKLAGQEGGAA